ncbi:MAG: PIN domain-containing protein [Kineosporiaceae bacterium]
MLVLDSGAVTALADNPPRAARLIATLRRRGLWPPVVPSVVLAESLTGDDRRDALTNQLLQASAVDEVVSAARARRAAALRSAAGRGSAVDALVVATAEGSGVVLTWETSDLGALAAVARGVTVVGI